MAGRNFAILCGGSGSSKFVSALTLYLETSSFRPIFIANVADNFWHYGLYICPDVDILTYCLAGILDDKKGWGLKKDTYKFLSAYKSLHREAAWFNLGDTDLALCLRRTELILQGWKLSEITDHFCNLFQIRHPIIPASDDDVQTFVKTRNGFMHLQEFWVKNKGKPKVFAIEHRGSRKAKPARNVIRAITDRVLILPANPVSSILPTIKLSQVKESLGKASKVIAISPFVSNRPFSGPAAKFMMALDLERSSFGVAKLYSEFLKIFLVDSNERAETVEKIRDLGIECIKTNIRIESAREKKRIASEIASLL
jgi:LPPG:FO 2-phospho-L-lactate transferase